MKEIIEEIEHLKDKLHDLLEINSDSVTGEINETCDRLVEAERDLILLEKSEKMEG